MRDAQAELRLVHQWIEQSVRDAPLRAELPARSATDGLRRRAGETLIAAGERLLPVSRPPAARPA